MSTSVRKTGMLADIRFTRDRMVLLFADGRELTVPLANFPRLARASRQELNDWRLIGSGIGIHWPQLDEDLSIQKLLDPAAPCVPTAKPRHS